MHQAFLWLDLSYIWFIRLSVSRGNRYHQVSGLFTITPR